jgi:thiol:disulfide interchange protein
MKIIFVFLLLIMPLLIVGTLASSLNLLPQAGSWTTEIKRFFGFVLIGISLYLLHTIISTYIVLLVFALLLIIVGITYFFIVRKESSTLKKAIKNNIGCLMLASSVFILFKSAQWYYQNPVEYINWHADYTVARTLACAQYKPLLIDIGSSHCSLCCSIDNHIFCNEQVVDCCNRNYIALKVDSSTCDEFFKQKYTVFGAPTILLVDPETEAIVKKWAGELYHQQPQQFIEQLRNRKP